MAATTRLSSTFLSRRPFMADCSDDAAQKARGGGKDFRHAGEARRLGAVDLRHREVAVSGRRVIFICPLVTLDFDDTVCLERPRVPDEQGGSLGSWTEDGGRGWRAGPWVVHPLRRRRRNTMPEEKPRPDFSN